mgnify:CR=1 FL=1
MKFIFPKNYKYRLRFLGFIDYFTGIVDLIIGIIMYFILNIIIKNIEIRIYIFISLYFPIILLSIFGMGNENILIVIKYMFKYVVKQKVYLYGRNKK